MNYSSIKGILLFYSKTCTNIYFTSLVVFVFLENCHKVSHAKIKRQTFNNNKIKQTGTLLCIVILCVKFFEVKILLNCQFKFKTLIN